MTAIAFIGLGNMGGPMAANLIKAGHQVRVFDLSTEAINELVEQGATSSASAAECASGADIVISMLPAGKHVELCYLSEQGMIHTMKPGTLVIDSSTIDKATAVKVATALKEKGIDFVDAPVSGGVAGAAAGTLSFMVGGSDNEFNRAQPVLEAMGKNIFHAGGHGAGQVAKVCNNMLLSILMAGTAEALQLGINNDLDPKVLSEIMLKSSGRNWTLELYNPCPGVMESVPAANDYQGGFMVDLMAKDLGLAMDCAVQSQSTTPMGALSRNLFSLHANQGNGTLDFSSIFKMYEKEDK
ncbi:3-hydroxyisobutyrate dehydrogenase [Thalassotalea mangrovi]|uniref:3-hydroxyisobutyrate dehydrogenase n=1 Tax=Thalassotalea mangrovi TaxID=2572245 RepID=A0A4U1B1N7_9GAMM|nr:3-hydroxyisobutyrate dehydrogenase [Thalassotalea mangrovi]TKB43085.1 3-hydroxyisobutyrate dehydrogenase [Thalassotalea mangrovi]